MTEAVIAVGTGVAATAKKNNEASKRAAEEAANKRAATKKAAEEAARKRAHVEAEETANLAEEAERNKEQACHNSDLNATAVVGEVCMSTRLTDDPNASPWLASTRMFEIDSAPNLIESFSTPSVNWKCK